MIKKKKNQMLGLVRACHVVTHLLYFQGFIETDRQGHMWIDEFLIEVVEQWDALAKLHMLH
jgi:hypothetical protein